MQTLTWRKRLRLERFIRGLGPEAGPVRLDRARVFILPTRAGFMFAFTLLVMLAGAINYNNSLGHLFTFLLASLAIVSILHTYRNLAQLAFTAGRTLAVFAGERAAFEYLVTNPDVFARYALRMELPGQAPVRIDLEPGGSTRVTLYRDAERRGELAPGRCTVSTRFPLSLFRAWGYVDLDMRCIVYPRPGPPRAFPQGAAHRPNQTGYQGRGVDDFAGFRTYRPGDSPRHVFWKAAAREQALLTKQFGGDRADELWLDWDALPALDTETRLSQLCRWVLDADAQRRLFGLRLPGLEIAIDWGEPHKRRCLEALARYGLNDAHR